QIVKIDGSSTVYPITNAIATEYQAAQTKANNDKIKVEVAFSGTGGGFKTFCEGLTDISNASRPILKQEMALCNRNNVRYIELPIAFDALTVVVHPENNWAQDITVEELRKVWEPFNSFGIHTISHALRINRNIASKLCVPLRVPPCSSALKKPIPINHSQ
ncbi:MAG TPA: substrate-binding domain-containing protein, partial [Stenomitos sp.]